MGLAHWSQDETPIAVASGAQLNTHDSSVVVISGARIVPSGLHGRHVKDLSDPRFDACVRQVVVGEFIEGAQDETVEADEVTDRQVPVPPGALAPRGPAAAAAAGTPASPSWGGSLRFGRGRFVGEQAVLTGATGLTGRGMGDGDS
ncbi:MULTISPECIES: hypothetical protein [unclassified Pseudofrankia]|uniref:hypothetical protein n=1 Tax=unclassified Pseudofrankia TaxID=2994372 RepID=UPI0008DB06F9|nr:MULTISPECIES: hypothetical protein [unclassified Pseudofrankia]MDT3446520.1 hypothetical protein [Pseudofrankia sp. BMG5.37]OHV43904.1 hypothetical protein BCD48_26210 [Pseudofrankia sp. BMG5.36]